MDSSKLVSRYVGSMAGIAMVHGIVAYFFLFRTASLGAASHALGRLVPFLTPLPSKLSGPWWLLCGLYLLVQGIAFGFAAAFPVRWPYRTVCLASSAAAATILGFLYIKEAPFPPFFFGFLWQASLVLWVLRLLVLEAWHRPFAGRSMPSGMASVATESSA